jgi:hypothetical protein
LRGSGQKDGPFWQHLLAKQPAFVEPPAGDLTQRAYWIRLASALLKLLACCPKANIALHEHAQWALATGRGAMFIQDEGAVFLR